MRRLLLAAGLLASCAHATAREWHKPDAVHGFGQWRVELQRLVNEGDAGPDGHFCIVVRDLDPARNERVAYVYWRERQFIQGYGSSRRNEMTPDMSAGAGRIDLRRGLVHTRREIGFSTSLHTRSYANHIINQ